jgi:hypothetical protein
VPNTIAEKFIIEIYSLLLERLDLYGEDVMNKFNKGQLNHESLILVFSQLI